MLIYGSDFDEKILGEGKFNCPRCKKSRGYKHKTFVKKLTLFFIPTITTEDYGDFIECDYCGTRYKKEILHPKNPVLRTKKLLFPAEAKSQKKQKGFTIDEQESKKSEDFSDQREKEINFVVENYDWATKDWRTGKLVINLQIIDPEQVDPSINLLDPYTHPQITFLGSFLCDDEVMMAFSLGGTRMECINCGNVYITTVKSCKNCGSPDYKTILL